MREADRSVLGWGLTWSGAAHVVAVGALLVWAMTLPADSDAVRPLSPVPQVDHPMNVQFVMEKGDPTSTAQKTPSTPEAAEPKPTEPQQVAEVKPPREKVQKKRRKKRRAVKKDTNLPKAVAPAVVADDAPPAPAAPTPETMEAASDLPPSPAAAPTVVAAANAPGNLGETSTLDLRGALRGYLKAITRTVHREYTYPRSAQRAGLEGRAVVKITIDSAGNVTRVELAETSGHSVLDAAALAAAQSLSRLPAAPAELQWEERSVRVPFLYSLTG